MAKFKVKKGKKFFWGPRWNFFKKKSGEFNVKAYFHGDCIYRLTDNYDQINKLTGESYRLFPWYNKFDAKFSPGHHKDSVRFGWRCVDGETIEILSYVYINGDRRQKLMGSVDPYEWVHLNFRETDSYYNFKVVRENGESFVSKFKKEGSRKGFLGLFINRLYPYFGGKIAAPHNMHINLVYLKKLI